MPPNLGPVKVPPGLDPSIQLPLVPIDPAPNFTEQSKAVNEMIIVKKSDQRRHIENSEQNTWLTFDHENKVDPLRNGFGSLQLFNEEILTRGRALKLHPIKEMVIVTYLQKGVVVYHGPFGGSDVLEPGDFHRINVGPDDQKYEFDAIFAAETHLFQSGFKPDQAGVESRGKKVFYSHADRHGILKLIASPNGSEASLPIQRDVHMYSTFIHPTQHIDHMLKIGRSAWLHVVKGHVRVNDFQLQTGDGAGYSGESSLSFEAQMPSEILLFDLIEPVLEEGVMEPQKDGALSQT